MPFVHPDKAKSSYHTVIIGSGFGSFFFLHEFLKTPRSGRTLLIEWGSHKSQSWQVQNKTNSVYDPETLYTHGPKEKSWNYSIGFGGGTLCWWGHCPRNHPNDFQLKSKYGIGFDWPFSYQDLAPYYREAEQIMLVSASDDIAGHYPDARGYAQPPHRMNDIDRIMKAAQPDMHFAMPSAVLSRPVGSRGACCVGAECSWCPVDAKFTALNSMQHVIEHPDLDICVDSKVLQIDIQNKSAQGVRFIHAGQEYVVRADLVVLGANALYSPTLLLQSGLRHPLIGRYIHEKVVALVEVYLNGVDNFGGSTKTTCINLSLLDGPHRTKYGSAMLYFDNHWYSSGLRPDYMRWREILPIVISVENLPEYDSFVALASDGRPHVSHPKPSEYGLNGLNAALEQLPQILSPLPVEKIEVRQTESSVHIQGTLRMGDDPQESVVDACQIYHGVRNLIIVGSSVFPSCGTAGPGLTVAAMSLRAARLL